MAPNPRVISAFRAMRVIGISEDKVKPVLKNLLKLYEKNWELIEEENYRALADAIFDQEEAEAAAQLKKPNNAEVVAQLKKPNNVEREEALDEATQEEPERPLKRLRLKYQDGQPSHLCNNASTTLTGSKLKKPKVEVDEVPNDHQSQQQSNGGRTGQSQPATHARNKGKQPISPNSHPVQPRDRGKEHLAIHSASQKTSGTLALIKPKDEPFTDDMPHYEAPLACLPPEPTNESDAPNGNCSHGDLDAPETLASKSNVGKDARNYTAAASTEMVSNQQLARIEDGSSSNLEIASSPSGEVKISINCSSAVGGPDFQPNIKEVLKLVEDRCLRSYKFLDPNFSLMKLMKDMCECIEILGTKTYNDNDRTETENMMTAITRLETSLMEDDFDSSGRLPDSTNELINFEVDAALVQPQIPHLPLPCNGVHDDTLPEEVASGNSDRVAAQNDLEQINFQSLVPIESCQPSSDKVWSLHDVIDITNGQEKMVIPIVNEVNSEVPPSFHYIAQSVVFQNAYVNFSLACIGDNHSCSTCSGDCLSLSVPCVCAQQTRGDFAYTLDGLLKEDLLKDCISKNQDPKKHSQFFCKVCPLERSKNDDIVEPCKGHLARTFIKECWWKCGCNKQCGNRVVQRGISRKLQVFMTSEGKGWGLRTLEDLPRGTFVCEYVGEVLTNAELFGRVSRSLSGEKRFHPVLLDADWGSGGVLKDEEALCLDATYYGNVARFINHRCFDSNLVEIPVEIESPDHHYYHLAFFTTRDVKAMEELTWDYGIDFDDLDYPIKAFQCQCGSQFCRNIKRLSRSRGRR